jgi:hypothetical protein
LSREIFPGCQAAAAVAAFAPDIGGFAQLKPTAQHHIETSRKFASARTGGGQIDFRRGSVRAQTGGGGIRIITFPGRWSNQWRKICLTRVAGAVQAATVTATSGLINPDASSRRKGKLPGASQLSSGAVDIVVLPRKLRQTSTRWSRTAA